MGGKIGHEALEKVKERPEQVFAPVQQEELNRQEVRKGGQPGGNPAPVTAQRTVTAVGPKIPQEAPAGKLSHKQVLGKLDEKERVETHSDEQRIGIKQHLLDNVALDEKKKYSVQFQNILNSIRDYARINVTGDGDRELLSVERDLLMKAIRGISSRLEELRQEGVRKKDEMEEMELLTIYEEYFKMDTGGYLEIPPSGEFIDCSTKELTGTYKNAKKEMIPITLKEIPKETPLFPHEPSVNDIAQGALGDCYLLAGLSSIVHASPQMIKDCMRDNEDGTVTVRFYRDAKKADEPMTPVYVRVKKSVPEGDVYAKGSLWVQMIEKAYAASSLHGDQGPELSYNTIAGGTSDKFISRLTGKKPPNEIMTKLGTATDNYYEAMLADARKKYEKVHGMIDESQVHTGMLGITLTGQEAAEEIYQFSVAMFNFMTYFDKMKDKKISNQAEAEEYFKSLKLEDLPDIIPKDKQTNEALIQKNRDMKATAVRQFHDFMISFLPHQAFSGSYPVHAEELYQKIQESVNRGERVTASTEQSFQKEAGGGLNGEGVELGLASRHAYTVMGVKQMGKNKYIQLRNPWAHMVRTYEKNTWSGKVTRKAQYKGNHGIFLVELNEFVTYYSRVRIL